MGSCKRLLSVAVLVLASMSFSGCLLYQDYIKFKKDGSGTISITYSINKKLYQPYQQLEQVKKGGMPVPINVSLPLPFDQQTLVQQLRHTEDPKKLKTKIRVSGGARQTVSISVSFKDVTDLSKTSFAPLANSEFSFGKDEETGVYSYSRKGSVTNATGLQSALQQAKGNPMTAGAVKQVDQVLGQEKEAFISHKVEMPATVAECNLEKKARKKYMKGKKVTWVQKTAYASTSVSIDAKCSTKAKKK